MPTRFRGARRTLLPTAVALATLSMLASCRDTAAPSTAPDRPLFQSRDLVPPAPTDFPGVVLFSVLRAVSADPSGVQSSAFGVIGFGLVPPGPGARTATLIWRGLIVNPARATFTGGSFCQNVPTPAGFPPDPCHLGGAADAPLPVLFTGASASCPLIVLRGSVSVPAVQATAILATPSAFGIALATVAQPFGAISGVLAPPGPSEFGGLGDVVGVPAVQSDFGNPFAPGVVCVV